MVEKKPAHDDLKIGAKIQAWRKKKDLTQDALAKQAEMPYTTLAKIESSAIKSPSIQNVIKIANALGIGLDALVK